MKLKPDLHECEHDLDGEREPLRLVDGRVGLYCRKCDSYVIKGATSTGNLSGVDQIASVTASEKRPGPSNAFQKENGKWTFHIFPNSDAEESGEYDTKDAADEASLQTLVNWQSNGYTYGGPVSTMTSPITIVRDDL